MPKGENVSTAVRQRRGKKVKAEDTPEQARNRALDYYPTPPWGARAGAEIALRLCPDARRVLEPACGEGHMAVGLADYFPEVMASDIHDHGFGAVEDFLLADLQRDSVDLVLTNPPFIHAEAFLAKALKVARMGVGLLCRVAFLEGENRYEALYTGPQPMTVMCPFIERLPMFLGVYDPDGSTASCYAWFFFIKGMEPRAPIPIPPGTKARLFRVDDVRRFCPAAPAPLLDFASS